MEDVYVISLLCTFLFCLAKLCEMKLLQSADPEDDEEFGGDKKKPLKYLLRDAVIVFAVSFLSTYIHFHVHFDMTNLMHVIMETKTEPQTGMSEVFTGDPDF